MPTTRLVKQNLLNECNRDFATTISALLHYLRDRYDWADNSFLDLSPSCGEGKDCNRKTNTTDFVAWQEAEPEEPEVARVREEAKACI